VSGTRVDFPQSSLRNQELSELLCKAVYGAVGVVKVLLNFLKLACCRGLAISPPTWGGDSSPSETGSPLFCSWGRRSLAVNGESFFVWKRSPAGKNDMAIGGGQRC
jgi:hypothetical protein